jgi:ATP-dependent DNA helicase RecG
MATEEVTRWSSLPEGQFFERKSALDRSGVTAKPRKAAEIARDVVETLCAMANADGGELVVGIENDGAVTGVSQPSDRLQLLLMAPGDRNYVQPPLRFEVRNVQTEDGTLLLHYSVEWSPDVHRLADGRYVRRVNDANMPFPAEQIAALKATKAQGLYERSFPAGATLDDLDLDLVASLMGRTGQVGSPVDVLHQYHLLDGRNGRSVPCLAALLLFGKDPSRWHPRCGIDFVRWEGTERKFGSDLNIAKRIRIEHPLAVLIDRAREAIRPFIRERQQLQDLLFTERLEYPTFVWQEAIVNAVAHRDYSIQGTPIEVWMFDDRIEIRSPGLPPEPVTVETLSRRESLHVSRNPLMVRVLVDLGYMRELGEGIPRMFTEMEREGFYPPRIEDIGGALFQVILRNQPVYDRATLEWLQAFRNLDLSGDQKRLLAFGHAHADRFTNRDYQKLAGINLYQASNSIRDLIRKGVVRPLSKGNRVYEILEPLRARSDIPEDLARLLPTLRRKREISNEDVRETLGISRPAAARLTSELCKAGWLERRGTGRWTRYRQATHRVKRSSATPDNVPSDG